MRALPVLIVSFAMAAVACAPNGESTGPLALDPTGPPTTPPAASAPLTATATATATGTRTGANRFPRALTPFADCSTFLDHVKDEARRRVGPYGLDGGPFAHWAADAATDEEATQEVGAEDTADAAAEPAGAGDGDNPGGGDGAYTTTNVQELGVDEPDIVKTDGTRILTITENRLGHVDVTGEPTLTDTLVIPEGWGHELFIRGDRALVFTNGGAWGDPMPVELDGDVASSVASDIAPEQFGPATLIVDVDLSDPADLRIVATMRIEGQYLSARAIDDRVRLAVTSPPTRLPWLYPQNQNGEVRAEEANRAIIDESIIDDWLPGYELDANGSTTAGPLLSCERAHRPAEFSGFDMVSIVDLDLATGLAGAADRIEAVGVLAGGQTVYSSTDRMYVATTKWVGVDEIAADAARAAEWNEEYETDLHAFDRGG